MSTEITNSTSKFTIAKSKVTKVHKVLINLINNAEEGSELDRNSEVFKSRGRDENDIVDAFLMCGWRVHFDDAGAVNALYYNNWKFGWGEDTAVLRAIAPYVKKGSKLTLFTEYCEQLVYTFDGKTVGLKQIELA